MLITYGCNYVWLSLTSSKSSIIPNKRNSIWLYSQTYVHPLLYIPFLAQYKICYNLLEIRFICSFNFGF